MDSIATGPSIFTRVGPVAFWSLALAVAAITLTIGNKFIMLHFHFPMVLLLIQNTASVLFILLARMTGRVEFDKFTFMQLLIITGSAAISTLQLSASLISLPQISIATLTVFGNTRALMQSMFECVILREQFSWKEVGALFIIAGTSVLYSSGDKTSSVEGIVWLIVNCVSYVILGIYKRFFYNRVKQTSYGIGFLENLLTLPFIVVLCLATGNLKIPGLEALQLNIPGLPHIDPTAPSALDALTNGSVDIITLSLIAFTSIFASTISIIYTNLFRNVAATTVTVLANMNKAISIVIAVFIFRKHMPPVQLLALAIVMAAGVWFALERRKSRALKKAAEAAPAAVAPAPVAKTDSDFVDSEEDGSDVEMALARKARNQD
jgi:drug/metabolite transporter (DMT)-like permease